MTSHPFGLVARVSWAALFFTLVILSRAQTGEASFQRGNRPAPLPRPTEVELGAPVYPGASYDGVASAALTQNNMSFWVFASVDSAAKVAAFYEAKTKLKPQDLGGSFLFVLKGKSPFPDHGIAVESNSLLAPPAKTTITFMKAK